MKIIINIAAGCVLALSLLTISGCATNAATGKSDLMLVSEAEEAKLSHVEHEEFVRSQGLYTDKALQDYVQKVGKKIVQVSERDAIDYQFFVLNKPEVNAFALPNGYVYVTRGLLAYLNSEAELAAVLSHEVAHVAARHSAQLMSSAKVAGAASTVVGLIAGIAVGAATGDINLMQSTMNLTSSAGIATSVVVLGKYSREHELEADQLGTGYMTRAGYPPQAMATVLDTFKSIEKFEEVRLAKGGDERTVYHQATATHPALDERIAKVDAPLVIASGQDAESSQTVFLNSIAGLVFESFDEARPVQSTMNTWFDRERLFQIYLPPEWEVTASSKDGVTLEKLKEHVRTEIRLLDAQPEQDAEGFFSGPKVGAAAVKDIKSLSHVYHKNPAFSAFAELKASETLQPAYLSVLFHEKYTVLLIGTNKDPAWINSHRYVFDAQTNLTKILTEDEYNQIRIKRIKVVKAVEGETYSALAAPSPLGAFSESYLRLINNQYPIGEPATGRLLKVVVAE